MGRATTGSLPPALSVMYSKVQITWLVKRLFYIIMYLFYHILISIYLRSVLVQCSIPSACMLLQKPAPCHPSLLRSSITTRILLYFIQSLCRMKMISKTIALVAFRRRLFWRLCWRVFFKAKWLWLFDFPSSKRLVVVVAVASTGIVVRHRLYITC